ncbi:hypothetical protein V6N12_032007 [Hibiscus sabdariffa]|uniref:Agenet domain-containing protein n=1 Tax=Hibiscus sabdariffa TaxID=183260 RepID=A0ABR2BYT4_9ROSI
MAVFFKGDRVEVCSKEEGFLGSYYEAKVVSSLNNNTRYQVRYKNLVEEDDQTQPLVEIVSADEVRPMPPSVIVNRSGGVFNYLEKVDAFDNDGWWAGRVTGKQGLKYYVYFETTGDELAYDASRLRNHIEWRDHHWVSFKKSALVGGVIEDNNGRWAAGFARNIGVCSVLDAELWIAGQQLEPSSVFTERTTLGLMQWRAELSTWIGEILFSFTRKETIINNLFILE